MNYDIIEVVLDMVVRRFKLREWQYDVEEMVEDVQEALGFIGAAKIYQEKSYALTFNNKAAKIPRDCINVKHLLPINTPFRESGNFIEADFADGEQCPLIYQAMPVDNRGYPVVPDHPSVRAAIMWYLAGVLILQGEIKTVGYDYAEREWQWRCGSARAYLNVMNIGDWNGVANDYTRLNPLKDIHETNYEGLGKPNTLDRDNRTKKNKYQ